MSGRAFGLAIVAVLAVACFVRVGVAADRELWYDDVARLRVARLPWSEFADRLAFLDNLKSPYLVGPHKLWTEIAGWSGLLALRGWSVVTGLALVAAAGWVAHRAAGRAAGVATAGLFALSAFHVRWSVEIHQYAPAALLALLAWGLALRWDRLDARRGLLLGVLAGFAVGTFPPVAFALLPILVLSGFSRPGIGWVAGAVATAAAAWPAIHVLRESQAITGPAFRDGFGWSPYFHPRKSPVELTMRLLGADIRQGAFAAWWIALLAVLGGSAAASLALSPERATDRSAHRRRIALLAGGVVPCAALAMISVLWIGVFTDRYLHTTAVLLVPGLAAALAAPIPGAGTRRTLLRAAKVAGWTALLVPLCMGISSAVRAGSSFPRDLTGRSYRCMALLDEEAGRGGAPSCVFVHGEAQTTCVILRSEAVRTGLAVRHLTTAAWTEALAADDVTQFGVPQPYGWPFGAQVVAGRRIAATLDDARAALRSEGRAWFLFERPAIVRTLRNEEEEEGNGVAAMWRACEMPPGPEFDAAAAGAAALLAGGPAEARVVRSGPAALVELRVR